MLTSKQQAFVDEYLKDLNATKAYIRAGYSPKTAEQGAARLFRNVKVQAEIKAAKVERSETTKIDAAWLITRLAEEAVADLSDIIDEESNLRPIKEWPKVWRTGLVQGIDIHTELSGGDSPISTRIAKVRLSDRVKRLELIGKHVDVQAWRENIGIDLNEVIRKDWRGKGRG